MSQRTLAKTIHKINTSFPVLLITGPRKIGKTTLLKMCDSKRNYVTLDDMGARVMAQNDPGLFMQIYKPPIIIEEVQYAPILFSYIKMAADNEQKSGMFWLTGSQKFHLMQGVTESMAGRVAIVDLLGLSQAEIDGSYKSNEPFMPTPEWIWNIRDEKRKPKQLTEVYEQIWLGSFPKLNLEKEFRDEFYSSYIQTYLERDVRDLLNIGDITNFYNFLGAIAVRTGQVINYDNLSKDLGIDSKTVKAWLSILEASGIIYVLRPYYNNLTKRIIKSPKIYFTDTGLCTYLMRWPNAASLEQGSISGAILETYMLMEVLKSYWHNGKDAYFYYYRDTDKKEIDLVIESGDTFYPVEFKKTATPSMTASKNFNTLAKLGKKVGPGAVICFVKDAVPISREVTAVPVGYL